MSPLVYNQELEKVGEVQNVLNHLVKFVDRMVKKRDYSEDYQQAVTCQ